MGAVVHFSFFSTAQIARLHRLSPTNSLAIKSGRFLSRGAATHVGFPPEADRGG